MTKLNPVAFGVSFAAISAIIMFIIGILGLLGVYLDAVNQMMAWHLFFSLTPIGIIMGMVESAVTSFGLGFIFAYFYNIISGKIGN